VVVAVWAFTGRVQAVLLLVLVLRGFLVLVVWVGFMVVVLLGVRSMVVLVLFVSSGDLDAVSHPTQLNRRIQCLI